MVPIAASVTATGREMIRKTKEMAESLVPGSRVVYGDSVAAHTPVVVRRGAGTERVAAIEDLCAAWRPAHGGKETGEFDGEVWSDRGWTRVLAVVRHRAGKPLVRVATPTGIVDVTTDHSLLRPDATPVTPAQLCVGDALLHAPLPRVGVGHAAELCTPSQVAAAGAALHAASLGLPFVVETARHHDGRDAFRVSVRHPGPAPTAVLSASRVAYPADAYVYDLTTANHHFAAGVGSLVVHNTDSVMVVFDVGEARRHDVAAHFEVAQRVARHITATFAPPNELEHEKCYNPYLLFSKKRYAGESARVFFFGASFFFGARVYELPGPHPDRVPAGGAGRRADGLPPARGGGAPRGPRLLPAVSPAGPRAVRLPRAHVPVRVDRHRRLRGRAGRLRGPAGRQDRQILTRSRPARDPLAAGTF